MELQVSESAKKQAARREEIAAEAIREYQQMAAARGNLDSLCEEIALRVAPSQSKMFTSGGQARTLGEKRTQELYDSTAAIALGRFCAIVDSLLTPRNQTWHRLQPSDRKLTKSRNVRLWFEEVNAILFKHRYAPKANFISQHQRNIGSLGLFGTGCLYIDELFGQRGLRYRAVHLGQSYIGENHQGIVDRLTRHFPLTARQAFQMFGDACPDAIKNALATQPDRYFYFLHRVRPRKDYDPERLDFKGMPFAAEYVSMEGRICLREEGFNTFPYAVSRYTQETDEAYGRSPAMEVLPAVKTLNEEKKTVLKQGHRAVDPIYLVHDDGIVDAFSAIPGSMVAGGVDASGRALVQALQPGNISIGKDLMDDERAVINDAFLVTLFQILTETPTMTATEVLERTREKGILLAPTVGRQESEYLGPMIERELDILARQGELPPMPPELVEAKGEYTIVYDSPLSRAQRAEEAAGVMRSIETALQVVNVTQNPEPLDYFDFDVIMPEMMDIQGVPERFKRSIESVQAIREGRAEAAAEQQEIQAAPAAAAMMKAQAVAEKSGK